MYENIVLKKISLQEFDNVALAKYYKSRSTFKLFSNSFLKKKGWVMNTQHLAEKFAKRGIMFSQDNNSGEIALYIKSKRNTKRFLVASKRLSLLVERLKKNGIISSTQTENCRAGDLLSFLRIKERDVKKAEELLAA